jgi:biofilm PGA synthesis N-glycosyltransferase PgaC
MDMAQRLLVVSPVRNEAAHIERVALAMAGQTRPPERWVVVDDGSTDETRALLEGLAPRLPFMTIIEAASVLDDGVRDRLAHGAEVRAFNAGIRSVDWLSFSHIAKLDGDVELPPRYFELLLERFALDPQLGLAGGVRIELAGRREQLERVPIHHHVPGALRCYTVECMQAIGGIQEAVTWDTLDEVHARMRGFRTRTFPELIARHHRPWGSANGQLRGHARHGHTTYLLHYPLAWTVLRAAKTAGSRPWGISGMAYLGGYLGAAARRTARVDDPEFRAFFRRELRERARSALVAPLAGGRPGPPGPATSSLSGASDPA